MINSKSAKTELFPMWMRRLRHQILDLDTTIAYDEAEQEEDGNAQNVPKVDGNTDSLGLDSLFEGDTMAEQAVESAPIAAAGEGHAMAEQAVESVSAEAAGEVETRHDDELLVSQNPSVDEESAGGRNVVVPKRNSVDEQSADKMQSGSTVDEQSADKMQSGSTVDEQSAGEIKLQAQCQVMKSRLIQNLKPKESHSENDKEGSCY